MRISAPILSVLAALATIPAAARADEVWVGVYDHDVDLNVSLSGYEPGADIEAGWRGDRLESWGVVGKPSPYAFVSVNTAGASNFVAAGLSWKIGDRFYARPGVAVAYVDYEAGRPDRIDYGTNILFAPEIAVGWQVSDRWSAEASWVHLSHAQIFGGQNPGQDSLGVRAVYRFGD